MYLFQLVGHDRWTERRRPSDGQLDRVLQRFYRGENVVAESCPEFSSDYASKEGRQSNQGGFDVRH
jgi:hypothetical protein